MMTSHTSNYQSTYQPPTTINHNHMTSTLHYSEIFRNQRDFEGLSSVLGGT